MSEIDLYDYDLPQELIAQEPVGQRTDARLMLVDRSEGSIEHHHVRDLPSLVPAGDTMVMNNSRVMKARLVGYRKRTGGRWQGLFLQSDAETGIWEVLTKTRGTLQPGEAIVIQDRDGRDGMHLLVIDRTDTGSLLAHPTLPDDWPVEKDHQSLSMVDPVPWMEKFGRVPIPPYIRDGQMVDSDVSDYQTVYAGPHGSVAAPTAGLHFTDSLLGKVRAGGVETCEVTLHVGIGTFRPISVDRLENHQMHREYGEIDQETADRIRHRRHRQGKTGGRTIAVGTTSVRVLESAALAGGGKLGPWSGETDLFIRPGFRFNAVDVLMTNFHMPKSSLVVLVSAFAGRELILEAYRQAIEQEYRFFSYGDAMLIV